MGGHVEISHHVNIGGGTVIHQFCKIGEHVMIGGGFKVAQDIIPFSLNAGYPLKCYGLNIIGLTRRGFKKETISSLKTAFRYIMSKKLTTTEALEKIESEMEMIPELKRMVDFIRSSGRGVTK
jgi:UDP-N-acetylglucosamine acyltransferase